MKDSLLTYIKRHKKAFGISSNAITYFIKNRYRKVTFFLFEETSGTPFAYAKCTPFPRDTNEIVQEYEILKHINSKIGHNLKGSVPEPISLEHIDGIPVLFVKYLAGTNMNLVRHGIRTRKIVERDFKSVVKWLIAFNTRFMKKPVYLNGKKEKIIIEPVRTLLSLDKTFSKQDVTWFFKKIKALDGKQMYIIPKHTDFWSGNIVRDKQMIRVLDWEDFGAVSLPLFDLFHFMVSYFLDFYSYRERDIFRKIFFTKTKYTNTITEAIADYCDAFAIDKQLADVFFFLYLVAFHNLRHKQEGPQYDVTKRSREFIQLFLKNRNKSIIRDIQ